MADLRLVDPVVKASRPPVRVIRRADVANWLHDPVDAMTLTRDLTAGRSVLEGWDAAAIAAWRGRSTKA
jgi:hypothetical protein